MKVAVNFNKESLKKRFESKFDQGIDYYEAIMSVIEEIQVEAWSIRRYDKLVGELVFENVDTGNTKPECCFDNQYIGELFQDFINEEMAAKPDKEYIQSVKEIAKTRIIDNLKRIFEEQIGLAKLKVKPVGWQSDRIFKYTVKTNDQWKKFIHRTIDISHEETWIVHQDERLIEVGKLHETYYGALNLHDITFEAQTRALRRLA